MQIKFLCLPLMYDSNVLNLFNITKNNYEFCESYAKHFPLYNFFFFPFVIEKEILLNMGRHEVRWQGAR